jgi:ferredoxin
VRWLKVLDQTKCIGCHACTTACKSENEVPVGVTRTYVKSADIGEFPQVRRTFQVTRCNQCSDAPCVAACPTQAMFRREDGLTQQSRLGAWAARRRHPLVPHHGGACPVTRCRYGVIAMASGDSLTVIAGSTVLVAVSLGVTRL